MEVFVTWLNLVLLNVYTSNVSLLDIHCRLEHPFLPSLKKLVPTLSHESNLDCDSCQLDKHELMPHPSKVNIRVVLLNLFT